MEGGDQRVKEPRPHTQLLLVVCGSSKPARVNAFAVNGLSASVERSRSSEKVAKHPPRLSFKDLICTPFCKPQPRCECVHASWYGARRLGWRRLDESAVTQGESSQSTAIRLTAPQARTCCVETFIHQTLGQSTAGQEVCETLKTVHTDPLFQCKRAPRAFKLTPF